MSVIQSAVDEANRQRRAYRDLRAASPELFGNHDGYFDNTPEHGPFPIPIAYERNGEWRARVIWGVHKYDWAMAFIYCVGTASDSRGERTDPKLVLDIRRLPKKYIGRFQIDKQAGCARRSHVKVFQRALADGLDLVAFAREDEEAARTAHLVELERQANERAAMQEEGRKRREAARDMLRPYIGEGTLVTHGRCGGTIEEHYVYDLAGKFGLCGVPTEATIRTSGHCYPADDIALANITHVEHVQIGSLEWAGKKVERPLIPEPLTDEEIAERDRLDAIEENLPLDLDEEVPF